jgi:hypothetical protein
VKTNNPQARPAPDPDTIFAQLLQDLPPETAALAREFNAFAGGPVAALGQGEILDFGAWLMALRTGLTAVPNAARPLHPPPSNGKLQFLRKRIAAARAVDCRVCGTHFTNPFGGK